MYDKFPEEQAFLSERKESDILSAWHFRSSSYVLGIRCYETFLICPKPLAKFIKVLFVRFMYSEAYFWGEYRDSIRYFKFALDEGMYHLEINQICATHSDEKARKSRASQTNDCLRNTRLLLCLLSVFLSSCLCLSSPDVILCGWLGTKHLLTS